MKNYLVNFSFALFVLSLVFLVSCNNSNKDDLELIPESECPSLGLNIGDTCATGILIGIVNPNCVCEEVNVIYDCPNLSLNIGDTCPTPTGEPATVDSNCVCIIDYDCPNLQLMIGYPCTTSNGLLGTVDSNCVCTQSQAFDCPSLQLNIGDACNDPGGNIGIIDSNCVCITGFDCPSLQLNWGDTCITAIGVMGIIDANCECTEACSGFDITLTEQPPGSGDLYISTIGGTAPFAYLWSTGETTSHIQVNTFGTFTVTATDANGCVVVKSIQL